MHIIRPSPPPPLAYMNDQGGLKVLHYTSFSSESFRRRFLRQNVPQAGIGRDAGVELYTKCTEKRSYKDISVLLQFWRFHPSIWGFQPSITPPFRVIQFYGKKYELLLFFRQHLTICFVPEFVNLQLYVKTWSELVIFLVIFIYEISNKVLAKYFYFTFIYLFT